MTAITDIADRSRLLEREAALETIDAALEAVSKGSGAVVFVAGAAGIGKTSLLSAGQLAGVKAGFRVASAVGSPMEAGLPFGLVGQAIVALGGSEVDDPVVLERLGGQSARLYRMFRWLTAVAAERPLLLALDDLVALGVIAAVGSAAALCASALADSGSSLGETIYVTPPVRSISVATPSGGTSIDICSAASPLSFPNGECGVPNAVDVTNGPVAGHIYVQGADAVPSDNGTSWQLCGGAGGLTCTGPAPSPDQETFGGSPSFPGQDQYQQQTETEAGDTPLTNAAQCNIGYYQGACAATAAQSITEAIAVIGPSVSSDTTATTFTSSVTWMATP